MAWLDERVWCHPKFTDLTGDAGWTWARSLAYSAGLSTAGHLTAGQQKLVGATPKIRAELIAARLWDENGDGTSITIHDWDAHNSKRDARRAADRERKRASREAKNP